MTDTASAVATARAAQTRAQQQAALQVCPVVLAGGAGSRLWPQSPAPYPKTMINQVRERIEPARRVREQRLRAAPGDHLFRILLE